MAKESLSAEQARLRAVYQSGLLDSQPEADFDRLAQIAARLLNAPAAFVTVVDDTRQFLKSAVGDEGTRALAGSSTGLDRSWCKHAVASNLPFIVEDARTHPLAKDNPIIEDGVIAYAGIPLESPDGYPIGAICVVDSKPRQWNAEDVETLRALARSAMRLLAEQGKNVGNPSSAAQKLALSRLLLRAARHLHDVATYERLLASGQAVDLEREFEAGRALESSLEELRSSVASDGEAAAEEDPELVHAVRSYLDADNTRERTAREFRQGTGQLSALEVAMVAHHDAADFLRVAILDRGGEL